MKATEYAQGVITLNDIKEAVNGKTLEHAWASCQAIAAGIVEQVTDHETAMKYCELISKLFEDLLIEHEKKQAGKRYNHE